MGLTLWVYCYISGGHINSCSRWLGEFIFSSLIVPGKTHTSTMCSIEGLYHCRVQVLDPRSLNSKHEKVQPRAWGIVCTSSTALLYNAELFLFLFPPPPLLHQRLVPSLSLKGHKPHNDLHHVSIFHLWEIGEKCVKIGTNGSEAKSKPTTTESSHFKAGFILL